MLLVSTIHDAKNHLDIFKDSLSEDEAKKLYRDYMKLVHPDRGAPAHLSVKLNDMYEVWKKNKGTSKNISEVEFTCILGQKYRFKYLYSEEFELGNTYYGNNYVLYELPKNLKNKKFIDNFFEGINRIKYPDKNVKDTMSKYFISKDNTMRLESMTHFYIKATKTPDVFSLDFVLRQTGKFDVKHTAWVITRLCSIACVLFYNDLSHNGINLQNCLVSPQYHSILLYGGWFYNVPINSGHTPQKMIGVPSDVYECMPFTVQRDKVASFKTDVASIKNVAKKLNGGTLDGFPQPIVDWFMREDYIDAYEMYSSWEDALNNAFGKRKFIHFDFVPKY